MRSSRHDNERGFSFLELLFALLIVSIILGLTFTNLRHSVEREGPRGLAHALAADLRAARAEAQKSGRLVAVCFPSQAQTNSLSKSFALRKGDQRGHLSKVVQYGGEFDAAIFLGRWGSSVEPKIKGDLPDGWRASIDDEIAIVFRPDGSAFSNDLNPVDGSFPILTASRFAGDTSGPSARLTAAENPNTVWVSSSGSIEVMEGKVPVGSLPQGGADYTVAEIDLNSEPPSSAPTLLRARFLPDKIGDLPTAYVGQNYVSIHPDQKEGEHLEYGLATIELKVDDPDGGPLHYKLSATTTGDDEGEFTVPDREGPLRYVYDRDRNRHVWYALISWRPPPGAPEDTEYELTAVITDPDGNTLEVSTAANLLPLVTSLPPSRLVLCTTENQLYLANLDGANEIHITKDGPEHSPFFSADGSHIFSFHNVSGVPNTKELRRRTADGTSRYTSLSTFTGTDTNVRFDPTFTFAAIAAPNGVRSYPWGQVTEHTDSDDEGNSSTSYTFSSGASSVSVNRVFIVNLMSNEVVNVSSHAKDFIKWNTLRRHAFYFTDVVPSAWGPPAHAPGPYRLSPGHDTSGKHFILEGYPSIPNNLNAPKENAYGKVFNPADRNWFLEVQGTSDLYARNPKLGLSKKIDSSPSGFENNHAELRTPTWAANGQKVAYIKKMPSGGRQIVTKHILNSDLDDFRASIPAIYTQNGPDLRSAQLSPKGKWVYFLRGNSLFRARNQSSNPPPANISSHLGKDVKSYVLSP